MLFPQDVKGKGNKLFETHTLPSPTASSPSENVSDPAPVHVDKSDVGFDLVNGGSNDV